MHRHTHRLWCKLLRPQSQAMLTGKISFWDKLKAARWRGHPQILDGWHHVPFVTFCVVKSSKTCLHPVSPDGNTYHGAIRRPQYVTSRNWPSGDLQPARMWPKPPKNKLTISPGSSHSLATECGQQGCMGVVPLPLEIKWRWTSGMPVARMWEPVPSWDALPWQWFPEYQVLGNPPWIHIRG